MHMWNCSQPYFVIIFQLKIKKVNISISHKRKAFFTLINIIENSLKFEKYFSFSISKD